MIEAFSSAFRRAAAAALASSAICRGCVHRNGGKLALPSTKTVSNTIANGVNRPARVLPARSIQPWSQDTVTSNVRVTGSAHPS